MVMGCVTESLVVPTDLVGLAHWQGSTSCICQLLHKPPGSVVPNSEYLISVPLLADQGSKMDPFVAIVFVPVIGSGDALLRQ